MSPVRRIALQALAVLFMGAVALSLPQPAVAMDSGCNICAGDCMDGFTGCIREGCAGSSSYCATQTSCIDVNGQEWDHYIICDY